MSELNNSDFLPSFKCILIYTALFLILSTSAYARQVTLTWDQNSEPDLSYYIVYWGTSTGDYTNNSGDIGLITEYSVEIPDDGIIYFFAVTAVDEAGLESDYSNEVSTGEIFSHSPDADAGPDQNVNEGETVTLDGSGSHDLDGSIVSYSWVQTTGTQVELDDATTMHPIFIAPSVNPEGEALTFELTVTDDEGLKNTDLCIVNVIWVNNPPVADAGPDQNVNAGETVLLDGSDSYDSDGNIISYSWTQTGGTMVTLDDSTASDPSFLAPSFNSQIEFLTFKLVVTDNEGLKSSSECTIEITPSPQVLSIKSGWNLVSLSNGQNTTSIEEAFRQIMDKVISIWSFANGEWRVYNPEDIGSSDLLEVEPGKGLWVNMLENAELPVSAITTPEPTDLSKGWNLVGFNASASQDTTDAISSIAENVASVWAYLKGKWQVYDPQNPEFSDLTTMEQGIGYWINVKSACSWTH